MRHSPTCNYRVSNPKSFVGARFCRGEKTPHCKTNFKPSRMTKERCRSPLPWRGSRNSPIILGARTQNHHGGPSSRHPVPTTLTVQASGTNTAQPRVVCSVICTLLQHTQVTFWSFIALGLRPLGAHGAFPTVVHTIGPHSSA